MREKALIGDGEFNYTGYEPERPGLKHWTKPAQKDTSKKRVHSVNPFFRNLFSAQFNKPLRRALFLDVRCFDKVF